MITNVRAGGDTRMDSRDGVRINPLAERCAHCGFLDIDSVPQPYVLIDARAAKPGELDWAELGNLFVQGRAISIFTAVIPGQFRLYPTVYRKTGEATPWQLCVPLNTVVGGKPKPYIGV